MRVVSWFSCGAASAVAAKLAVEKYGEVEVVYCDTSLSEHKDSMRFFEDVEEWLGQSVKVIYSKKFASVDEVFEKTRYMAGPHGARCTVEMKKIPRFEFQRPDDLHIFGYTANEVKRMATFVKNNPELQLEWILVDQGIMKSRCYEVLTEAGIELPEMYKLGYKNNNCIGCVKATSVKYWNMIRRDFPKVFNRRIVQSRELGVRLVQYKGDRIFLDELPVDFSGRLENISCGPECGGEV